MIDVLALSFSALALLGVAILLKRDAARWNKVQALPGDTKPSNTSRIVSRIEAMVKRQEFSTEPAHRTTVAYVKDIMAKAERDAARIRFK